MLSNRHRHSTESSMFRLSMMYLWVLYLYFGEAINIIYFVTFCLLKAYLNSWESYASWLWEESWYMFQDWQTRRNHRSQVAERGLSNQPSSDPSVKWWSLSHWNVVRYPVPVCFNKCWITGQKSTHQTRIHDVKAWLNFRQVALEEESLRACKRCVFQSILVWKVRAWIIPKQDSIQHYSITSLDCINFGYATQLANQRVGSCCSIASTGTQ